MHASAQLAKAAQVFQEEIQKEATLISRLKPKILAFKRGIQAHYIKREGFEIASSD